jgi:predicted dehydrogenase
MERIRIGIAGLNFGRLHVHTLANMDEVTVAAVADRDLAAAGDLPAFAQKYGAAAYADAAEMIEREQLDAIALCVPPHARLELIERAAQRNLPMWVEKPWAADLAQARRLADLCHRHQATVMLGFSFRFHPAIVRLRQLLDGELGAGWLLNGQYLFSWKPPANNWLWNPVSGNGFFNENSCHLFDAVCYLLGAPESVFAETCIFQDSPSAEAASVTLRFTNDASAALTLGCLGVGAFHNFPRIELVTANGQAHLSGRNHIWESLTWATRAATNVSVFSAPPETLGSTRYTNAWRHFIECLRHGHAPAATMEDGIRSVAIASAIDESARTGRRVIVDSP